MSDDKRRDIPINRNYPKKVREINIQGEKRTTLDIGSQPFMVIEQQYEFHMIFFIWLPYDLHTVTIQLVFNICE